MPATMCTFKCGEACACTNNCQCCKDNNNSTVPVNQGHCGIDGCNCGDACACTREGCKCH
ncbi:metallothionein 2 [Agaricus bisporus var. bisporus H97]|uniref:metallothionein 2 n=1 Tax=Agaricus bisporus var. bisporus (strain H97 / ATCC MYA-4626 / FGSC 10389) TaxID=936046 RepID=UPI00029F7D47|nr:metallothionein 2 [Agaricus bisporus var. bisporus H97]EKV50732.1 metallothionein 2 [Agaricus bisporus var. bisporus H97]